MKKKLLLTFVALISSISFSLLGNAVAQDNGGPVPTPAPTPTPTPTPTNQGGGSQVRGQGAQQLQDFDLQEMGREIVDERKQPFVGPSSENTTHFYSNQTAGAGTGGRQPARGGGGFRAGGGVGTGQLGFTIPRLSVRASLQNRIVVPNAPQRDANTSARFQQRFNTNSNLVSIRNVSIAVENRRAILTGSVPSEEQRQLVERMARLEPGIYAIDNQIVVTPTGAGTAFGGEPSANPQ